MKHYVPTQSMGEKVNNIVVETYYHKGGMNYFTYKIDKRGLYLMIKPVFRQDKGGYYTEMYEGFSGYRFILKELGRKSEKQHRMMDELLEPLVNQIAELFVNRQFEDLMRLLFDTTNPKSI